MTNKSAILFISHNKDGSENRILLPKKYENLFKKFSSIELIFDPSLEPMTMCYKGFLGGKGKTAPRIFFGDFKDKWDFFVLYFLYEIQHLKGVGNELEVFSDYDPKAIYFKNLYCWYKALYDLKYGCYNELKFISGYKLTIQMFKYLTSALRKEMVLENKEYQYFKNDPNTPPFLSKSQIKKEKSFQPFRPKKNEFPFNLYPSLKTRYTSKKDELYSMWCTGILGGKVLYSIYDNPQENPDSQACLYYGNFFQRKDLFYLAFFHELGHLKCVGDNLKELFPQEISLPKAANKNSYSCKLLKKYSKYSWQIYNFFKEYFCWVDALKTLKFIHHIPLSNLTFPYIKWCLGSYIN